MEALLLPQPLLLFWYIYKLYSLQLVAHIKTAAPCDSSHICCMAENHAIVVQRAVPCCCVITTCMLSQGCGSPAWGQGRSRLRTIQNLGPTVQLLQGLGCTECHCSVRPVQLPAAAARMPHHGYHGCS